MDAVPGLQVDAIQERGASLVEAELPMRARSVSVARPLDRPR